MSTTTQFEPSTFREVLGHYPTGVVIVTGTHPDGEPLAMVVGTFTSVSQDPPLVAFMPMKSSSTFERLRQCETLCINVLTAAQEDVARQVSTRRAGKLDGIAWSTSPAGSPRLDDSLAWLDVSLDNVVSAGDHWIALCRIETMGVINPAAPLIFFQGGYGAFAVPALLARNDFGMIEAVQQASRARELLSTLAGDLKCEATLFTVVNRDELAAVATAVGDGVPAGDGLGVRIPILPPIGDVWAAEQDEEEQHHWLRKADADPAVVDCYRDRLAFARKHGYLMSFVDPGHPDGYRLLHDATHRYADGGVTPVVHKEIRRTICESGIDYHAEQVRSGQSYDIGMLAAAVHQPDGQAVRILRLARLPQHTDGAQVLEWIETLTSVVPRLEKLLFD